MEDKAVQNLGVTPSGPGQSGQAPEPVAGLGHSATVPNVGCRPAEFTDAYRDNVCRIGQGADCCRYLTMGAGGFSCAKHTSLAWAIDSRADSMKAKGDNCDGVYELRRAFRLTAARFEHAAGTVIYEATGYDYGCASDDEAVTGKQHTSMTIEPSGDYPFFTVPNDSFEPVEEPAQ